MSNVTCVVYVEVAVVFVLVLVCQKWLTSRRRGSEFLKAWMGQLEEQADLRYPDLAEVWEGE